MLDIGFNEWFIEHNWSVWRPTLCNIKTGFQKSRLIVQQNA